jgi:hypothetical protein
LCIFFLRNGLADFETLRQQTMQQQTSEVAKGKRDSGLEEEEEEGGVTAWWAVVVTGSEMMHAHPALNDSALQPAKFSPRKPPDSKPYPIPPRNPWPAHHIH